MIDRRFRVTLRGRPVQLRNEKTGELKAYGFFATRFVRAADEERAIAAASAQVRSELAELGSTEAVLSVSEVAPVSRLGFRSAKGFTFFPDPPS